MFKTKNVNIASKIKIITLVNEISKYTAFFTSCRFIIKLHIEVIKRVMLYPYIFILLIDVNIDRHTKSKNAIIREFLTITPCLFRPFKIPNIVEAVKNIGADIEAIKMYPPRSLRP